MIMLRISKSVPFLALISVCALVGPGDATSSACQLPGIGDEASWREQKLRELKSKDAGVRREAASALLRNDIDGKGLIDALILAISDDDIRVRSYAIKALGLHGVGRSDVVEALRKALADCNPLLATEVIYSLREADPALEESLDALTTAALCDDRDITPVAVRIMKEIGAPAVTPLVAMLEEPSPLLRKEAILTLVDMGEFTRPAIPKIVDAATAPSAENVSVICPKLVIWSHDAVAELIKTLRHGPQPKAKVASDCLAEMKEEGALAAPALLEIAEDAQSGGETRLACILAMARVGRSREDVFHCMMKLAENEPVDYLRTAAIRSLPLFGEHSALAVPMLVTVARDEDGVPFREAAIQSLGRIKPAADIVVPLCIDILNGDNQETLKRTAAWVVGEYGPEAAEAWPALRPMLKGDERVRKLAIDSMVALGITDPSVLPDLLAAIRDGKSFEQEASLKALVHLGPSASSAVPELLELVRGDAQQARSAAYALGVILPDDATIPPEITDKMRRWFDEGRRFQRDRARLIAQRPQGPIEQKGDDAQRPNEITGIVLVGGVAVEGARVLLSLEPTGPEEHREVHITATDDLGVFRMQGVPNKSYPLVAFHPDHEPYLGYTRVNESSRKGGRPSEIQLRPTQPTTFMVVNGEGAPLPDVVVKINAYRGTPMPVVEFRTDASGAFSFPVGTGFVSGEAEHPGYMRSNFVLSQDEANSKIVMLRPYRIRGTVTDANTGAPIPSFTVTRGIHISETQTYFEEEGERLGSFTNGAYEIIVEESANRTPPFNQMALAFDAPNHQRGVSRAYTQGWGDLTIDILLVPQVGTEGRLIDEDGSPVAQADVILVPITDIPGVGLFNGRPHWTLDNMPRFTTSTDGRFTFPPQSRPFVLLVAEERGHALVVETDFAQQPAIQLTRWAQLSGVVRSGNKVVPGAEVDIRLETPSGARRNGASDAADVVGKLGLLHGEDSWGSFFYYSVKTDDQGKFLVDRMRPGNIRVGLPVKVSFNSFVTVKEKRIKMFPGQAYDLTIGGGSRRVIGRINLPRPPSQLGNGFGQCTSSFGGVAFDRTVKPQPSQEEALNVFLWPKPPFPFGFHQEDGAFAIDDIEPGKYRLVIGLRCAGESTQPDFVVDHEIDVPEGDLDLPVDLGELKATRTRE